MSQSALAPPIGFDDLTVSEQIEYVQTLWDRIAAREADVPVPEWHRELVEQRLADGRAAEARSWAEVKADLEQKLANRKR